MAVLYRHFLLDITVCVTVQSQAFLSMVRNSYFFYKNMLRIANLCVLYKKEEKKMQQVMRVQWFLMKKEKFYRLMLAVIMGFLMIFMYEMIRGDTIMEVVIYEMLCWFMPGVFIQVILLDYIMNADWQNGIMQQNLMAGVNRRKIFWGKCLFGSGVAFAIQIMIFLICSICIYCMFGWKTIGVGSMLFRIFLLILLQFRIMGIMLLGSVLLRKPFILSGLFLISFIISRHYMDEMKQTWIQQWGIHQLIDEVLNYSYLTVYGTEGGIVEKVQYFPSLQVILSSVPGSFVIGGFCLILAQMIFVKREY